MLMLNIFGVLVGIKSMLIFDLQSLQFVRLLNKIKRMISRIIISNLFYYELLSINNFKLTMYFGQVHIFIICTSLRGNFSKNLKCMQKGFFFFFFFMKLTLLFLLSWKKQCFRTHCFDINNLGTKDWNFNVLLTLHHSMRNFYSYYHYIQWRS